MHYQSTVIHLNHFNIYRCMLGLNVRDYIYVCRMCRMLLPNKNMIEIAYNTLDRFVRVHACDSVNRDVCIWAYTRAGGVSGYYAACIKMPMD